MEDTYSTSPTDEKIVSSQCKIDLHIHSIASFSVDGDIVKNNTEQNLSEILLPALNKESINLAAITDHNTFSYSMYCAFKKLENKGSLKKVLPGIEFDLDFLGKDIHAIFVFDDSNELLVSQIESKVNKSEKDSKNHHCLSRGEISALVDSIGINFVVIVHQKTSIENSDQGRNLAQIGEKQFDMVISADYFDAVEFKNFKVEGFLNAYSTEHDIDFKCLSGTDCHCWNNYPFYNSSDKCRPSFSFLKCLPSFKGLAMAITGRERISFTETTFPAPYLPCLRIKLGGKQNDIVFSEGINVVIGDNSIGKSLLLHAIKDPTFSDVTPSGKKEGYLKFCNKNSLVIDKTNFLYGEPKYDWQGSIRKLFDADGSSISDVDFIKNKIKTIDVSSEKNQIEKIIENFLESQKALDSFCEATEGLDSSIEIQPELNRTTYHISAVSDQSQLNTIDYSKLITDLGAVRDNINQIVEQHFPIMDKEDMDEVNKSQMVFNSLWEKYRTKERFENYRNEQYATINSVFSDFSSSIEKKSTSIDALTKAYQLRKSGFAFKIASAIESKAEFSRIHFEIPNLISLGAKPNPVGKYKFVSKAKVTSICRNDIEKMLCSPVLRIDDFSKLSSFGLKKILSSLNKDTLNLIGKSSSDSKDAYIASCIDYATTNWLALEPVSILRSNDDILNGNSSGLNALYYLDLYSVTEGEPLYILDQPEDDVSEIHISHDLIDILRTMAKKRQIIFVTHRPELVVNLDADNVVVIKRDKNNRLNIFNGALEYENKSMNVNILDEVATLLDGGAETIRKRWKRYAKGNNKNSD